MRTNHLPLLIIFFFISVNKHISAQASIELRISNLVKTLRQQDNVDSLNQVATKRLKTIISQSDFEMAQDTSKFKVYQTLGIALHRIKDYPSSIKYVDDAISIAKHTTKVNPKQLARAYMVNAKSRVQIGILAEAENEIQEAIGILKILIPTPHFLLSEAYRSAGNIFVTTKDLGQADIYYQSAISYAKSAPKVDEEALRKLYADVAWYYSSTEQANKALDIYNNQKNYYEKTKNKERLLVTLAEIGTYHSKLEECEKAIVFYSDAKNILLQLRENNENYRLHQLGIILNSQAYCSVKLNNLEKAKDFYSELLKLGIEQNSSLFIIIGHEGIGDVYREEQDYDQALQAYQKAIQYTCLDCNNEDYSFNPSIETTILVDKVSLKRILGLKAETLKSKFTKTDNITDLENSLQTYRTLDSLIDLMRNRYRTATSKYRQLQEDRPVYKNATKIALQLHQLTNNRSYLKEAFHFSTKNKAIVLLEGLKDENAKIAGIPDSLLQKERRLKKQYNELERNIIDWQGQDSLLAIAYKERLSIKQDYDQLIVEFEEEYPKYHRLKHAETIPTNPDSIQAKLAANQALVEYFVTDSSIFIYTISKLGLKVKEVPKPENFDNLCKSARLEIEDNVQKTYAEAAYELYKLLLEKPLEEINAAYEEGLEQLIIIPDDILLKVSFDGLLTKPLVQNNPSFNWNDSIPYLINSYAISYAYSNQLIFAKTGTLNQLNDQILSFGLEYNTSSIFQSFLNYFQPSLDNDNRGKSLSPLKNAVPEIEEIATVVDSKLLINRDATKVAFMEQAPKHRFIHLSLHGLLGEDHPLNSSLVFSSEKGQKNYKYLTGWDIYNLSLNAEMITLSACSTADGSLARGDGIRSLTRAFQYAGVPSVIASLWGAHDKHTKEIMVSFYKYLAQGFPKNIAMQKAKKDYLNNPERNIEGPESMNLDNWANLIVIGNTESVKFNPVKAKPVSYFSKFSSLFSYSLTGLFIGIIVLFGKGKNNDYYHIVYNSNEY